MKRLLHATAQKPDYTGSGIYLQGLIRQATEKSYPQALIAGVSRYDDMDSFRLSPNLNLYPVYFESEKMPFPVVGMSDVMPYTSTRYSELTAYDYSLWKQAFTKTIKGVLTRFNPEVIISHHLWLLSVLIKELAPEIPVIAISHGTELRQLELTPHFADDVIAGCSQIEQVVALNDFQAGKIASIYNIPKTSIMVGGIGFNPDIFYPPAHRGQNRVVKIIYAGKVSYAKGVGSLLRACELLYSERPDFELLLLGSGDGKEKRELAEMMSRCSFRLTAPGAVSQTELGEIFRQGDVFVLPSFYEGLPLVVIEALASGLRVVVSDLPGLRPWLGKEINDSGLICYVPLPGLIGVDQPIAGELPSFETGLKNSILKQMNRLHLDDQTVSLKMRRAVKKLSWAGLFQKIEALL